MITSNWHVFADTYTAGGTTRTNLKDDSMIAHVREHYPSMSFKTNAHSPGDNWFPVITATPGNKIPTSTGCNIVFNLNDTMSFGKGDCRGYVSFAFCNNTSTMGKSRIFAIPDNLFFATIDEKYANSFENANKLQYTSGPMGNAIWRHPLTYGFSLTLYPKNDNAYGTREVSYYKLSVKNWSGTYTAPGDETELIKTGKGVIVYEDELPEKIDLGKKSSISLNKWHNQIKILLNGMEIITFTPDISSNINDLIDNSCRFTMACMGGSESIADFSIHSINGIAASEYNN